MALGAGKLDTRCVFQKELKVPDGGGGNSITWPEQFTLWGGFAFPRLSTRMEAVAAGAVQGMTRGELVVRESTNSRLISKDWRVVAKGRTWNIGEPQPDQRDGYLRMPVESGVAT